jgi:hypothetical protein
MVATEVTWLENGSHFGSTLSSFLDPDSFWSITNKFFSSQGITAWVGLIRVDGVPYTWMGAPPNYPQVVDQTDFSYTSTRSTFIMNVGGKVGMNITFMSPVTPDDLKRQSLTFTYLDVAVESIDGASHDVQIYADVSGGTRYKSFFPVALN